MPRYFSRPSASLSAFFFCTLLALLSACSSPFAGASSAPPGNTDRGDGKLVMSQTATSQPLPQVSTSCPAAGTARAAIMPVFQLGTHQAIVYYHNSNNQMVLDVFDVQRRAVSPIISEHEQIQSAQVSADGQWVLMVISANNISALQLVRMDGQLFQTIYCAPSGQQIGPDAQWSPNQKQIIFSLGNGSSFLFPTLYLLQLVGDPVQIEVSSGSVSLSLDTWLDNTRVYFIAGGTSRSLYLLDTSKGPNQPFNNMQLIKGNGNAYWWSFDTSIDGKKLYMSILQSLKNSPYYQSEIDVDAIDGNGGKQILLNNTLIITDIRVIDSSSLMFVSFAQSATQEQSANFGWWKINTDGSGLTHLNKYPHEGGAGPGVWGPFNPSTQYTWSNFSRNDAFYADGIFYGSLSGGPLTRYTTDGENDILVGWTTM